MQQSMIDKLNQRDRLNTIVTRENTFAKKIIKIIFEIKNNKK